MTLIIHTHDYLSACVLMLFFEDMHDWLILYTMAWKLSILDVLRYGLVEEAPPVKQLAPHEICKTLKVATTGNYLQGS